MPGYLPQQVRGVRHALTSFVPGWLANRRGLNTGFKFLYMMALMGDFLLQMVWEGLRAAIGNGTVTALPYLGAARGILQGLTEPNPNFIQRVLNYLATWFNAGSDEMLLYNLQQFIWQWGAGRPMLRVVSRSGFWVALSPNGSFTTATDTGWDWDNMSNPERAAWWSDIWIIIYPTATQTTQVYPVWSGTGWNDATANTQWQTGGPAGVGLDAKFPRTFVDGVLGILRDWKGAHAFCQAIIWCPDQALFTPGSLGGIPDGKWGNWGKRDPATGHSVPSRLLFSPNNGSAIIYWTPRNGGG